MFVSVLRKRLPALTGLSLEVSPNPQPQARCLASSLGLVSRDKGSERRRKGRVPQLTLWTQEPTQEGNFLHKAWFSCVSFCSALSFPGPQEQGDSEGWGRCENLPGRRGTVPFSSLTPSPLTSLWVALLWL